MRIKRYNLCTRVNNYSKNVKKKKERLPLHRDQKKKARKVEVTKRIWDGKKQETNGCSDQMTLVFMAK